MGARMRVLSVIGTRPEAIKMAPVIKALQSKARVGVKSLTVSTGQHEIVGPILDLFGIVPDFELGIMKKAVSLNGLFSIAMTEMDRVFSEARPDIVLVQGDTTSAAAAAIAAFNRKIRVGHIEAGLRTGNTGEPWPEEINRRLIAVGAGLHFAPTSLAKDRLIVEGVPAERIVVTGNTVIDALQTAAVRLRKDEALISHLASRFAFLNGVREVILVTTHRRENIGQGIEKICKALLDLSERRDLAIVFPVHPNPQVHIPVMERLGGRRNIHLIPPADYVAFVYLMMRCRVILTDSGGIQEEAPSLGKHVLVMRDVTERQEAVDTGAAQLVGTDPARIIAAVSAILENGESAPKLQPSANPFGDGRAAERIVQAVIADELCNISPAIQQVIAKGLRWSRAGRIANRVPLQGRVRRGQGAIASA